MQKTIFKLLTNKKMRKLGAAATLLHKELNVGAPWYDKNHQGSLVANT